MVRRKITLYANVAIMFQLSKTPLKKWMRFPQNVHPFGTLDLLEDIMTLKEIEVVPYNPDWPKLFDAEAAKIKQALGPNCIAIHHIGSTAVPNLAAKPIIDILPVVLDLK